jgi:hypothetical protein
MTFGSIDGDDGGNFPSPPAPATEGTAASSNPTQTSKPSYSAIKCDRLLASLQDCVKKHPTQQDTVCAHLHQAAGWCLIRTACPIEGKNCSWNLNILY